MGSPEPERLLPALAKLAKFAKVAKVASQLVAQHCSGASRCALCDS